MNQGKGRALKTAFSCLLNEYKPEEISGVVTVDADGQHSPEDPKRVAEALLEEEALILGTRNFSKDTPFKSRYGNHITTAVFALLYGKKIRYTQTGLRGIPYGFLAECLRLEGERFEYEIKMLIDTVCVPDALFMGVGQRTVSVVKLGAFRFEGICGSCAVFASYQIQRVWVFNKRK